MARARARKQPTTGKESMSGCELSSALVGMGIGGWRARHWEVPGGGGWAMQVEVNSPCSAQAIPSC